MELIGRRRWSLFYFTETATCNNFTCPVGTKPKRNPWTITCNADPCKTDECCNSCRDSAFYHDFAFNTLLSICFVHFLLPLLPLFPFLLLFLLQKCTFFTTVLTSLPETTTCANYACPTGFKQKSNPTSITCDRNPCKVDECCNRNSFAISFGIPSAEVFTVC